MGWFSDFFGTPFAGERKGGKGRHRKGNPPARGRASVPPAPRRSGSLPGRLTPLTDRPNAMVRSPRERFAGATTEQRTAARIGFHKQKAEADTRARARRHGEPRRRFEESPTVSPHHPLSQMLARQPTVGKARVRRPNAGLPSRGTSNVAAKTQGRPRAHGRDFATYPGLMGQPR